MKAFTLYRVIRTTLVFRRTDVVSDNIYSVNVQRCSAQDKHGVEKEIVLERGPRFLFREGLNLQKEFRAHIFLYGVRGAAESGILSQWMHHAIEKNVFSCRPLLEGEKRKLFQICNVEILL